MKPPKSKMAELSPNATGGGKFHAETAESAEFKMTELGPIPGDRDVKTVLPCNLPLPFRVIRLKGLSPCH